MENFKEKKFKVLVVDDNNENIRIIGSILRQQGYQVGFATGGRQALSILEENQENYDLILLDVNMPDINGFEVCRQIRKNQSLSAPPIVFLTANTAPEHIMEGFSSGGQDYVTKPFHPGELLARISTHIELRESRKKLSRMNAILEEKVNERTCELQEANQKLEAAYRELANLDQAKADFLSLISHEINTPLNGIIGLAELLKAQLVSTEYFDYIEYLSESANRLCEFAHSSLIITNMRTSPELYKKLAVNLGEIVEQVLVTNKKMIDQKKAQVIYRCSSDHPLVEGNKDLIQTCMSHLLQNALRYTPEGNPIYINIFDEHPRLMVSFEDSGPGFSDTALQLLFKPFSPGERHVDKNKGLGLSLVKMILDFHRAEIDISNISGRGAKVVLGFDPVGG